jgi:serine/threonine protein kinase
MVAGLIEAIERIHDQGVVHGDIHWGNVVLVKRGDQQSIALIDFGNAMFVDEMVGLPEMARAPRSLNHCLYSHWNIEGFRFSYRDDVYKALLVLAFVINGFAFENYCLSLEQNVEDMLRFKREEFLFSMPAEYPDRITGLSLHRDIKRLLRLRLENALQMARSVEAIDERPNYRFIVTELQAAAGLLRAANF